jgi:hypothetical protein
LLDLASALAAALADAVHAPEHDQVGTKGAVRDMAAAVGEGLRGSESEGRVRCHKCNTGNEATAKFCKSCGAPLNKTCPNCGELNDVDARFCDGGGKVIA